MGRVISKHNSKVSNNQMPHPPPGCNCRGGAAKCPVGGACLTEGVIYQASVEREDDHSTETYTGLTARTFKRRLYEHTQDFNHQNREGTTLSKHVWGLKTQNIPHKISWQIVARGQSFNPTSKQCILCLKEKFFIMFRPEGATLNDRNELFATCRHRLKPLLANT